MNTPHYSFSPFSSSCSYTAFITAGHRDGAGDHDHDNDDDDADDDDIGNLELAKYSLNA